MEFNLQEFISYMNALGQQIGVNNQLLLENVNQMIQKAERQNRKRRRKKEGDQLIVSGDLYLSMNRFYDDGTNELSRISDRLTGKNETYTLDFQGLEETEKFGIFFESQGIWVIGSKNKVKPSYLFDCFVKAAGSFCLGIAHKTIGELLYDHWAVIIEQTENRITVPVLAGWDSGDFLHKDNFMFKRTTTFPFLPVLKKEFPAVSFTEEGREHYFSEFRKISRWKERLLITLYPFMGILSSVFSEMHSRIDLCLNFVEIEPIDRKIVCSWLKIFNRTSLLPHSLDLREAELRKMLSTSKDEVLIFDANVEGLMNDHYRKKIKKNVRTVIAGMKSQGNIVEEQRLHPSFACAFFARERILERGVYNMIVDAGFYQDDRRNLLFVEHKIMEGVLTDFVQYVKREMEHIWGIIMKKMRDEGGNAQMISSTYEIVEGYWKEKGVDLIDALQISSEIEWSEILDEKKYDDGELLEIFVSIMRKGVNGFCGVEKRRGGVYMKNCFFYSEMYIWFPTKMVRSVLRKQGMLSYMNTIFLILREKGGLVTDQTGFSRKLQIAGNTVETYQIERVFFNRPGISDIVDLAKGEYL